MDYFLDYETRSPVDLKTEGTMKYVCHDQTDIVMLTWATRTDRTKLWLPGAPPPFSLKPTDRVYAFNAYFDVLVQNYVGTKYGLPHIAWEQTIDVMALVARFALPQNLDKLCQVLQVPNAKLTALGRRLMKKICKPPYEYTREEFKQFVRYGLQDTTALVEIIQRLPNDTLSPSEQRSWVRTQKMNARGVRIDTYAARRINMCVNKYKKSRVKQLPKLTNNTVQTAGQIEKIRQYCLQRGVELPNMQARTIETILEDPFLPHEVREVLKIRRDVAATSVKKYQNVLDRVHDGKLHDFLVWHAASTGRFSSRGLQIHNLIRRKVDDPQAAINEFFTGEVFQKDVIDTAKGLIRSIIRARENHTFIISDSSSIEYVVCLILAEDWDHLQQFADGVCPYTAFGVRLFQKAYNDITKGGRQNAKPGVLGGIYGLSGNGYVEYAKGFGIKASESDGKFVIDTFRSEYNIVQKFWYKLKDMAVEAVAQPGSLQKCNRLAAKVAVDQTKTKWLLIRLPSGRTLAYYKPELKEGRYGLNIYHYGVDSQTRQWARKVLSVPRLIENVTQATARDILVHCEARIEDEVDTGTQVFSCHDEVVVECNVTHLEKTQAQVHEIMSTPPDWLSDLPLKAETFNSNRYTKG